VRRRVLHVTQTTGGVETSLLLFFRHFHQAAFEWHLVCPPGTNLATQARALGVEVYEVAMVRNAQPVRDLYALVRLAALMRRAEYSIVHGHSAKGGYLARLAARVVGGPKTVYHPHAFSYLSQVGGARRFFLQLERMAVPFTDLVIATSESERRRAIEDVHFPESNVVVIPNSIDFTDVQETPVVRQNGPIVLTVGRLSYQKNPEMFVRVAKRVSGKVANAHFIILGGGFAGPLEGNIRRMIDAEGLAGRVEILPWTTRREALKMIASCDVFVLTSRFEGMPNTLLEALMLTRPVVVTDVDGNRDVMEGMGFTVPPDDDEAMANQVVELLNNEARAREVAIRRRERIQEVFDIHRNVDALEKEYERLLAG
jgi:glycosyltransferase involved in cell wall biosynthesis